jgi:hypothetical protein
MGENQILERAKSFLYKNGRLLDRRRYEYYFEEGSKEAVIDALRAYQNRDGGFGNALEPDIRCPHSQPVPTEMALAIMDEVDGFALDLLEGIIRYLRNITLQDGGIPFVFRNAGGYPHAPWWGTDQDDRPSINPIGRIIGLLCKQNIKTEFYKEEWFLKNVAYIWRVFEQEKPNGYHDGIQWITFLQHTHEQEKAGAYWPVIDEWLRLPGTIERDPQTEGYIHKVLDWAPVRDSYANKFFSNADLQNHLQALVGQQQEDGGWPINWPPVSLGGEVEWRGWVTVERLKTLKSYGIL